MQGQGQIQGSGSGVRVRVLTPTIIRTLNVTLTLLFPTREQYFFFRGYLLSKQIKEAKEKRSLSLSLPVVLVLVLVLVFGHGLSCFMFPLWSLVFGLCNNPNSLTRSLIP